jgi:hypothetical protein
MFIKSDSKNMETNLLKRLCRNSGIKNYSRLKKAELLASINKNLAAKTIQRCFRRYFYKTAIDHITLEPVDFPCFVYRTKSGRHYFYSHDSIIKYIMKTGNTRDPMTREQYSDEDLQRLDLEAKRFYPGVKYRSTYKIKKNLAYARRIKNRENEIMLYQMRLDEMKEILLFIVESDMVSWEISNEPILIENVEFSSVQAFIDSVLHELKIVIENLRIHEPYIVEMFKNELSGLTDKNKILGLINNF